MMCRPSHSLPLFINTTLPQHQQQQQEPEPSGSNSNIMKPKRSVRFASETNICSIPSSLEQLDEISERSALWYNLHDLSCMRNDSKRMCEELKLRQQYNINSLSSSSIESSSISCNQFPSKKHVLLAFDSETRGLEARVCMERQKRRYVTVRFIVSIANKLKEKSNSNIIVANASQRCTSYATNLAIEEAARDYRRAYYDYDNEVLVKNILDSYQRKNNANEMIIDINKNINNKRVDCQYTTTTSPRNVRARLCSEC